MAITKIHAIKSTLACALNYIENPAKTLGQLLISGYNVDPQLAAVDFEMTASLARQVNYRGKRSPNLAYHLIQSFAPDDFAPNDPGAYAQAHELGRQLAAQYTGGRFEYVVATHIDQENHIHNHIMINAVSFYDYHRLRTIPYKTARELRAISDRLCTQAGLSVIEHPQAAAKRQPGSVQHSIREDLQLRLDTALLSSDTYDRFKQKAAELGVCIDDSGKHLKFRLEGAQKWIRGKSIAEDGRYTAAGITQQLNANRIGGAVRSVSTLYDSYEQRLKKKSVQSSYSELRLRLRFVLKYAVSLDDFMEKAAALGVEVQDHAGTLFYRLTNAGRRVNGKRLADDGSFEAAQIVQQCTLNAGSHKNLRSAVQTAAENTESETQFADELAKQGITVKIHPRTGEVTYSFVFEDQEVQIPETVLGPNWNYKSLMDAIRSHSAAQLRDNRPCSAEQLQALYADDQKQRPTGNLAWVLLSPEQIHKVAAGGLILNVLDAQEQPAQVFIPRKYAVVDKDGRYHISLASMQSYVLQRSGGCTYSKGETLIRQLELQNGVKPHRIQIPADLVKTISLKGVNLKLPEQGIERLFIPAKYVQYDLSAGTCTVDLYDNWNYTYTPTSAAQAGEDAPKTLAGKDLYGKLSIPVPSAENTTDLRRMIRAVSRKARLEETKQLSSTLLQMSEYHAKTAQGFERPLTDLQQQIADVRMEIDSIKEKNSHYALAARCLQTYQKLLPVWQGCQEAPRPLRSRLEKDHRAELDAFRQALAALERMNVSCTVDPQKVVALIQDRKEQLECLETQLTDLRQQQQKLLAAQAKVQQIQSTNTKESEKNL